MVMHTMTRQLLPSVCPLDCPDTCSLSVEITAGHINRLKGSSLNPTTDNFICAKVAKFAERVYHQDRLLYPLRRIGKKGGGAFERISWHEAVTTICARLKEVKENWGGEAILPYYYGGSNGMLAQGTADTAFFRRLGASQLALTVCAAPTSTVAQAMYGKMPGVAFADYVYAKFILIWGANPKASNIHRKRSRV